MKKIIIVILTCVNCIFCSTQTKLNTSKEIDILIKLPAKLVKEVPTIYTIKNNTNDTYIIVPYGYIGDSYWKRLKHEKTFFEFNYNFAYRL